MSIIGFTGIGKSVVRNSLIVVNGINRPVRFANGSRKAVGEGGTWTLKTHGRFFSTQRLFIYTDLRGRRDVWHERYCHRLCDGATGCCFEAFLTSSRWFL